MIQVESTLFFPADDEVHGWELWRTDGTESGTILLKDITPGAAESSLRDFQVVGSNLFFRKGLTSGSLWKSDGTPEGTVPVKEFTVNAYPCGDFLVLNPALYFRVYEEGTDGSTTTSLWRTDGTKKGAAPILSLPYSAYMSAPIALGPHLLFLTEDPQELWRSDGTREGTVQVMPLPGDVYDLGDWRYDPPFLLLGAGAYFFVSDPAEARGLWRTDGTQEGTRRVKQGNLKPDYPSPAYWHWQAQMEGVLYFAASDEPHGSEIWRTDGTETGTYMVEDIYLGSGSSLPESLTVCGSTLFFTADDGIWGRELWKVTGSKAARVGKGWSLYR